MRKDDDILKTLEQKSKDQVSAARIIFGVIALICVSVIGFQCMG